MAVGESKEADYGEVLLQIVARLRDILKPANEATCYLSLDPDEVPSGPGDHCYSVSPLSGKAREGAWEGAGIRGLAVHSGCIVTIHLPTLSDELTRDVVAITGESLGLIRKASAVISALAPSTADDPAVRGWIPTKEDYSLTSPFRFLGYSLHRHENKAIRSIELTFQFEFDWDTTQR